MQLLFLFVGNVASHLVALMSGIASVIVATYETIKGRSILARSFWSVALVCLIVACDEAWQDEHRNTQSVIADKSSITALYEDCHTGAKIQNAYTKGLEGAGINQRNTIDSLQQSASKAQSTINNCVVSLGKMNPIIRDRIAVIIVDLVPLAPNTARGFVFLITTSAPRSGFHGYLRCSSPFVPVGIPSIPKSTSTAVGSGPAVRLSDREYELEVSVPGADWSPNSPAWMKAYSTGESPKDCEFIPI